MKKPIILLLLIGQLSIINCQLSTAQNDTTLSRVVTVERDFQPVIQSMGKINQRPSILSHEVQLNPVVYSTYSDSLTIGHTLNPLRAAEARFTPQAPLNGILDGGIGHYNTHLLFGYQLKHKEKMTLDLYANHDAYWGINDILTQSQLGMQVKRHFSKADLYVQVDGAHEYWSHYTPAMIDEENFARATGYIGLRSNDKTDPVQYRLQTGYTAYFAGFIGTIIPAQIEQNIRTYADIHWQKEYHGAGANIMIQNTFYPKEEEYIAPRHALRVEPFYQYTDKHIRLHAGVNLDMNILQAEQKKQASDVRFRPSPNVTFEWRMMDDIFHLYADAKGMYDMGTIEEYIGYNRYGYFDDAIGNYNPLPYTPVDAQIGVKIRPFKTLLLDIHGGYALLKNQYYMYAHLNNKNVFGELTEEYTYGFSYQQSDYHRWQLGASLHYHYQDIIELNASGNYYFWQHKSDTPIYDRPNWDVKARLDIHLDSKWSIYSDNQFAGSRLACTSKGDKVLKPIISLNIGGQYAINRWLVAYLQLNNYLNRKHDIFYGYPAQSINFLLGIKWQF